MAITLQNLSKNYKFTSILHITSLRNAQFSRDIAFRRQSPTTQLSEGSDRLSTKRMQILKWRLTPITWHMLIRCTCDQEHPMVIFTSTKIVHLKIASLKLFPSTQHFCASHLCSFFLFLSSFWPTHRQACRHLSEFCAIGKLMFVLCSGGALNFSGKT